MSVDCSVSTITGGNKNKIQVSTTKNYNSSSKNPYITISVNASTLTQSTLGQYFWLDCESELQSENKDPAFSTSSVLLKVHKKPPTITSSPFSSNGLEVQIQFSKKTNKGDESKSVACSKFFTSVSLLGQSSSCSFGTDASLLKVVLGSSPTILVNSTLTFKSSKIATAFAQLSDSKALAILDSASSETPQAAYFSGSTSVESPSSPIVPSLSIESPSQVSTCESSVSFRSTVLSGSGARDVTYSWSVSPALSSNSSLVYDERNLEIDQEAMGSDLSFTVSLNVTNFLGGVGSASVQLQRINATVPQLVIAGGTSRTIKKADRLVAVADVIYSPCIEGLFPVVTWEALPGTPASALAVSQNPRKLIVPSNTLTSDASFRVWANVTDFLSVYQDLSVTVEASEIVAAIQGGDRILSEVASFTLVSGSFDPDDPDSDLAIHSWNCSSQLYGNCSLSGVALDEEVVSIPAYTLSPDIYTFSLYVEAADGRSDQASVSITVTEAPVPEVRISLMEEDGSEEDANYLRYGRVNPGDKIVLLGDVSYSGPVSRAWSVSDSSLQVQSSLSSRFFVLSSGQVTEQSSYTFTLTATAGDTKEEGYASITVLVNSPPKYGSMEVSPSSGVAFVDDFTLTMSNWEDIESDYPLTYLFFSRSSMLAPESTGSTLKTILGGSVGSLPLKCEIRDSLQAVSVAKKEVELSLASNDTQSAISTIKDSIKSDFEQKNKGESTNAQVLSLCLLLKESKSDFEKAYLIESIEEVMSLTKNASLVMDPESTNAYSSIQVYEACTSVGVEVSGRMLNLSLDILKSSLDVYDESEFVTFYEEAGLTVMETVSNLLKHSNESLLFNSSSLLVDYLQRVALYSVWDLVVPGEEGISFNSSSDLALLVEEVDSENTNSSASSFYSASSNSSFKVPDSILSSIVESVTACNASGIGVSSIYWNENPYEGASESALSYGSNVSGNVTSSGSLRSLLASVSSLSYVDCWGNEISVQNLEEPIQFNTTVQLSEEVREHLEKGLVRYDSAESEDALNEEEREWHLETCQEANETLSYRCNSSDTLLTETCEFKGQEVNFSCPLAFYVLSCVYWDEENEIWSNEGCSVVSVSESSMVCECNHLTQFTGLAEGYLSNAGNTLSGSQSLTGEDFKRGIAFLIVVGLFFFTFVFCIFRARNKERLEKKLQVHDMLRDYIQSVKSSARGARNSILSLFENEDQETDAKPSLLSRLYYTLMGHSVGSQTIRESRSSAREFVNGWSVIGLEEDELEEPSTSDLMFTKTSSRNVDSDGGENRARSIAYQRKPSSRSSLFHYDPQDHTTVVNLGPPDIMKQTWQGMKKEHILFRVVGQLGSAMKLSSSSSRDEEDDVYVEELARSQEEELDGDDAEYSHKQRVIMFFSEFITIFFLSCFLYEQQFIFDEWKDAVEDTSLIPGLLLESFWEIVIAVLLTFPVNELLHRLFNQINSVRNTRRTYQSQVLRERAELMKVDLNPLSIREAMVVESKLDVLVRFWQIAVHEIREIEGEEAYDQALRERLEPVKERYRFVKRFVQDKKKAWRQELWDQHTFVYFLFFILLSFFSFFFFYF